MCNKRNNKFKMLVLIERVAEDIHLSPAITSFP